VDCIKGNLDSFKSTFQDLVDQNGPNPLQPAACLAAQKERVLILDYCLEQGAIFDRYLTRAAQMGAQSSAMLELLLRADWAGIRSDKEAIEQQVEHFGRDSFQAHWLLQHVGSGASEWEAASPKGGEEDGDKGKGVTKQASSDSKNKSISTSRDPIEGKGSESPKQRPDPSKIQKWFGDVPW
jgi:hypothetical protein